MRGGIITGGNGDDECLGAAIIHAVMGDAVGWEIMILPAVEDDDFDLNFTQIRNSVAAACERNDRIAAFITAAVRIETLETGVGPAGAPVFWIAGVEAAAELFDCRRRRDAAAGDGVVALTAIRRVAGAGNQRVVAQAAVEDIAATADAGNLVVAVTAVEKAVTARAVQCIVAEASEENVEVWSTRTGWQALGKFRTRVGYIVVAVAAIDEVVAFAAVERV